ncbi:unnamed protein product [Allacma fusca]|uniref:Probable arginine--tRNA ligase, mitochondrial n=1 Tax=Allacma fusca TaxID=39272 RepID=A0A8J2JG68_9HEXA|nr:unnamed protein product [Allacma fusca]
MGTHLRFGVACRNLLKNAGKHVIKNPSKSFTDNMRLTWVSTPSENDKRIGLRLQFPTVSCCQDYQRLLNSDRNVTILTGPKAPTELILLPAQSSAETLQEVLTDLIKNENQNYTILRRPESEGNVMVEFGSPNIAKPLHMGHLRSAVTGNYVARIYKAMNQQVSSFCFLGDWGTQFGLLHAGLDTWNEGGSLLSCVERMDLSQLLEIYVRAVKEQETNPEFAGRARELSAALEKGDPNAVEVWRSIREKSTSHLDGVWAELGIKFDVVQAESEYTMQSGHTDKAMLLLQTADVIQTKPDGCQFALVQLTEKAKQKLQVTLVKSDGSSLYILRDIAAAVHRTLDYKFDRLVYIVDKSQSNHFLALFDILRQIDINKVDAVSGKNMFKHVSFGRVSGQSTRSGTFSLLSDVIRDGTDLMDISRASSPNTRYQDDVSISKNLAISSLLINAFKVRRNKDLNFDWSEALKASGDTGVSIQYGHARLVSLLTKLKDKFLDQDNNYKHEIDYEYILQDPIALDLALQILK